MVKKYFLFSNSILLNWKPADYERRESYHFGISLESPNQQKKSCMKNGKEKKQPDQRRGASTTELLIK